jgi:predicted LPLAT superfamily acyltransferase
MANKVYTSEHWSEINEKGAKFGMQLMFSIYKYCGRLPFYFVLLPVIAYFYLLNSSARNSSLEYLNKMRACGVAIGNGPVMWLSYCQFYKFGCSLLDKLAVWSGRLTLKDLIFYNYDEFDQYNKNKIGTLIIGSHLGNIEVCRALAKQKGALKINVLVHTKHSTKFNSVLRGISEEADVNLIQVTEIDPATAILLNDKISKGEHIVIAGDRTPINGQNTCQVNFFNTTTHFPKGPFILASILKCPVFTLFCIKENSKYGLHMEILFSQVKAHRSQRDEILKDHIQQYANRLQEYCAKSPLQWYNFYPFWKAPDTDQAPNEKTQER